MVDEIMLEAEERMGKAIEALKREYGSLRAGRATPSLLDKITVEYYGAQSPINQVANISVPEARLLVIQPWDKSIINEIEKSIMKSDLGLTPNNDGIVIRIAIPALTEDRRKQLVKVITTKAEDEKVAIRNVRRDANDQLKDAEKEGMISEDDLRRALDNVQKLTDKYIAELDKLLQAKEKEVMEV